MRKTLLAAVWLGLAPVSADAAAQVSPATLKDKFGQLRARFEKNPFGRPLALDSSETGSEMRGDAYAVVEQPFHKVRDALARAESWCEILTLPFNVQKCEAAPESLQVYIGRKPESPIEDATRLNFRYAAEQSEDLLQVRLTAPSGPAGTRDYRIAFTAVPVANGQTLVHFSYGYATGMMSRMALQTYLSTSGANKVGFSAEGADEEGRPRLVGGVRGVIERNTMRYFLAVDAFLKALDAPADQRRRVELENWFNATERYPRQLHEMSRQKYLDLKLRS